MAPWSAARCIWIGISAAWILKSSEFTPSSSSPVMEVVSSMEYFLAVEFPISLWNVSRFPSGLKLVWWWVPLPRLDQDLVNTKSRKEIISFIFILQIIFCFVWIGNTRSPQTGQQRRIFQDGNFLDWREGGWEWVRKLQNSERERERLFERENLWRKRGRKISKRETDENGISTTGKVLTCNFRSFSAFVLHCQF